MARARPPSRSGFAARDPRPVPACPAVRRGVPSPLEGGDAVGQTGKETSRQATYRAPLARAIRFLSGSTVCTRHWCAPAFDCRERLALKRPNMIEFERYNPYGKPHGRLRTI